MEKVASLQLRAQTRRESGDCPSYHSAIELIGKRWNGVILRRLGGGALRFSELRSAIPGITDTMLTQRLRELEDAGIVNREVVNTRPVDIRYGLTEVGNSLSPILDAVANWSNQWVATAETDPAETASGGESL
jgi:DNA-binding HxlR family transcriptional regulator